MLKQLTAVGVGPEAEYAIDFGKRLNVFTGDNALGKSFVLDMVWWALAYEWFDEEAFPNDPKVRAKISAITSNNGDEGVFNSTYYSQGQHWNIDDYPRNRPDIVVYAGMDGIFSVWDSLRNVIPKPKDPEGVAGMAYLSGRRMVPDVYRFTPHDLLMGLYDSSGKAQCNGLLRDVAEWQARDTEVAKSALGYITNVLQKISCPGEELALGKATRLYLNDVREYPTIRFSYGDVPVIFASAAVKRILSLAYLLVWTWTEHLQACQIVGQEPGNELVFIIDEVEAHLHPRWQRYIMQSLLNDVAPVLSEKLNAQFFVTTHSPLVLASIEPLVKPDSDKLFLFSLLNGKVQMNEQPWIKRGDAVGWLTSDIFGLHETRSPEAEMAIERAMDLMDNLKDTDNTEVETVHQKLIESLADNDPFWLQWKFFREKQQTEELSFQGGEYANKSCVVSFDLPKFIALRVPDKEWMWTTYGKTEQLSKPKTLIYGHVGTSSQPMHNAVKLIQTIRGEKLLAVELEESVKAS